METALTVAPLVLSTYKLIAKINQALEKPSQNKEERDYLAGRLSVIDKLLPRLQQHVPESAEALAQLGATLKDAHELVVACQKWSLRKKFTRADVLAEGFRIVNRRIDSHLITIQLYCQVDMIAKTTASRYLTVATTARYGQSIRKRDVIRGSARMLIGIIFNKPEYIARGASAYFR